MSSFPHGCECIGISAIVGLELLLLPEKHRETNYRSVNKKSANNRHNHRRYLNGAAVGKDGREG